jgi:hypothetical protein
LTASQSAASTPTPQNWPDRLVPIAGTAQDFLVSGMAGIDRDMCRQAAAECIELARATSDPAKKEILIIRAQEWLKLAYANNDAEFGRLVAERNQDKMSTAPVQRVPMQQQPVQQQQSKIEPDAK